MKKIIIAVVLVLAVVGGLAGVKTLQIKTLIEAGKNYRQPPTAVSSAVAHQEKWQDTLDAVGSISAVQGVNVTPEVAGAVVKIAFESGAVVSKGDLLVKLDTSSEDAQLKAAEAQLDWARVSAERARKLRADTTMSQSELDQAEAAFKQAQANVDVIRATIEKKTIRAPFAGKLGIRLVNLGQYLDTGKPIVSLQSLSPVYVDFSLPQQDLAQLKTGMHVRLTSDAYPNQKFEGVLTAINPDLDDVTRSVRLQATLDNTNQLLRPGMFAKIQVLLPGEQNVLVIPATSILSAPYGDSVFVIESSTNAPATTNGPALEVRQQFVRTGRARGDFVSIESGLKSGDRVVTSGLFKLRNQMPVVENNEMAPKAAETPKPSDS
jgi:membrane fusion protein (multidrug efflux system)